MRAEIFVDLDSVYGSIAGIYDNAWTPYASSGISYFQAGSGKGRGTRDQIVNIHWIIEKETKFQENNTSALLTMPKPLTV